MSNNVKYLDVSINQRKLDRIVFREREREGEKFFRSLLERMEEYTTMRKIVRVRSLCAMKWSRRWKVARPCLQTVKRWARGTGRGESRGVQKPAGFYGLRTAVYRSLSRSSSTRHTEKPFAPTVHRLPISNYNPSPLLFRPARSYWTTANENRGAETFESRDGKLSIRNVFEG